MSPDPAVEIWRQAHAAHLAAPGTVNPHDPEHRLAALVENAIGRALTAEDVFMPLSVRGAMARAAIEAAGDWLSGAKEPVNDDTRNGS